VPAIVLAGKDYGAGSARDWAAKGTALLGVRAVIAESYERIHRANLVGMGVLPLQFRTGESVESLGLTGEETFTIRGIAGSGSGALPAELEVAVATGAPAVTRTFRVLVRVDTDREAQYYRHGGTMRFVIRHLMDGEKGASDC
jgi:aconitate hydratase